MNKNYSVCPLGFKQLGIRVNISTRDCIVYMESANGIGMRVVLFVFIGIVVMYGVGYMIYTSYKNRKLQRHLKYGREVAANLPDDDGTVGPVKTIKRDSKEFEQTFKFEKQIDQGSDVSKEPSAGASSSASETAMNTADSPKQAWAKYYQFNIVSRDHRPFTFAQLRDVFKRENLAIGKYDIVYYNDPVTGRELFRVSSMIKPGTFPKGITGSEISNAEWSTKGICVIMFMPEPGSAEARFSDIINHVKSINTSLDGLLCTKELRPMTDDVISDYLSQMKAYDRQ